MSSKLFIAVAATLLTLASPQAKAVNDRTTDLRTVSPAWTEGTWSGYLRCAEKPHGEGHSADHRCALVVAIEGDEYRVESSPELLAAHRTAPWSVPVDVTGARTPTFLFGGQELQIQSFRLRDERS